MGVFTTLYRNEVIQIQDIPLREVLGRDVNVNQVVSTGSTQLEVTDDGVLWVWGSNHVECAYNSYSWRNGKQFDVW